MKSINDLDNSSRVLPEIDALRSKVIRVYSPSRERLYMQELLAGGSRLQIDVPEDCLSAQVFRYTTEHPEDTDVKLMKSIHFAQPVDSKPRVPMPHHVLASLQRKVLLNARFITAIAFTSKLLNQHKLHADILIFDKAVTQPSQRS